MRENQTYLFLELVKYPGAASTTSVSAAEAGLDVVG